YATRVRVLCGWYASLCGSHALCRWQASPRGTCSEGRDNMIGELLNCEIGGVDLDIGASVGVNSLVHQLFDSSQSGLSARGQFRARGFRSLDARGDDFGPRRETHDQAGALERRAI